MVSLHAPQWVPFWMIQLTITQSLLLLVSEKKKGSGGEGSRYGMWGIQQNKECGHFPSQLLHCWNLDRDLLFFCRIWNTVRISLVFVGHVEGFWSMKKEEDMWNNNVEYFTFFFSSLDSSKRLRVMTLEKTNNITNGTSVDDRVFHLQRMADSRGSLQSSRITLKDFGETQLQTSAPT